MKPFKKENMDLLGLHTFRHGKEDIAIRYFQKEFNDGERILDLWQRLDGWSGKDRENYRPDFIRSILQGNDIPKIMEYTLHGDATYKKRILDGGHRTRCINSFMKGEFPVKIGENYYYWILPQSDKPREEAENKNRELPEQYKHSFLDYKLTVTTYHDLTDEQAREKFNELNHCRPMNTPEVINSHSSFLVDHLRKEWSFVNDPSSEEYKQIQRDFSLTKKDIHNLNHMKVMVSLFSLIERDGESDNYDYCQPGDALKYVRACDDEVLNTQFTRDEFIVVWQQFTDGMEQYREWIDYMFDNGFTLASHSEALTYFQYVTSCDLDCSDESSEDNAKIIDFSRKCKDYRKKSPKYEKELKDVRGKPISKIEETQQKLNELNDEVGELVVDWIGTFKNNGSGKSNLRKREGILQQL